MVDQLTLEQFNDIYDKTYYDVLKFIIYKCKNMNDINDIMQETYLQLYQILCTKNLEDTNIKEYIYQIANYKIKKNNTLTSKFKSISLFSKNSEGVELIDSFSADIDIEGLIMNDSQCKEIWQYLKTRQVIIPKVFFLHYCMDLTIREIAVELDVSESYVKNCLYRTIKELRKKFRKVD